MHRPISAAVSAALAPAASVRARRSGRNLRWNPSFGSRPNQESWRIWVAMLAQVPKLPPAVQRIATKPVLAFERPVGFRHVKVIRLAPNRRLHTLGAVRIDFSNRHATESTSDALLRTHAAAIRLARIEAHTKVVGPFRVRSVAIRRFAVAVAAYTGTGAKHLLALAVAHLRRSEGWK